MAFPTEVPMPNYIIYRDTPEGQAMDLTAPLVFFPPKDSDELFDALRAKYPHLRTHSERTREAVIEFLLQESQISQSPVEQFQTPQTANSTIPSPWQASMQSMTSDSSTWSSPDILGLATPTFGNSPQLQAPSLARQFSTGAAAPTATPAPSTTEPTPPAIENMTGVFSLTDASQPKQRVRRKMTEAEKVEYRKRRIVKACEKCAKRKRKCQHNQPDMDTVASTEKSHKVAKTATATSRKVAVAAAQPAHPRLEIQNDALMADMSMAMAADLPEVLEDPMPAIEFDDFLAPAFPTWAPDWTLFDSNMDSFATQNQQNTGVGHEHDFQLFQPHDSSMIPEFDDQQHLLDISSYNGGNGMLWEHLRTGQEQPTQKQQSMHTPHVHEAQGPDRHTFSGEDMMFPDERATDWREDADIQDNNRRKDGQVQANPKRILISRHDIHSGEDNGPTRRASLSQMTLRLTGTAKAVKAFGNLLSPRQSRLQSVSIRKIALAALGGLSMAQQLHTSQQTDGHLLDNCVDLRAAANMRQGSSRSDCGSRFMQPKDLNRHMQQSDCHNHFERYSDSDQIASRPLGMLTTDDYLHIQTNNAHAVEGGCRTQHETRISIKDAHAKRVKKRADLNIDAVSDSGGASMEDHADPTPQQGRPLPSLGEGLTTSKSLSTDLYMLKRRIPKALHSVVDRNNLSAALGPLLTTIPTLQRDREREMISPFNAECTESNATQVNGGAYQRVNFAVHKSPFLQTGPSVRASVDQPVQTRPRNPTATNSSSDTDQHHSLGNVGTINPTLIEARIARAEAPAAAPGLLTRIQASDSSVATQSPVYGDRLSDHMRRRDHFGRQAFGILLSVAALAWLLTSLSTASVDAPKVSLLLLALLSPILDGSSEEMHLTTPVLASIVRCTTKNSSWLSGIHAVHSWSNKVLRSLVQREAYRDCQGTSYQAQGALCWQRGCRRMSMGVR